MEMALAGGVGQQLVNRADIRLLRSLIAHYSRYGGVASPA
jgi:hypothetical protein